MINEFRFALMVSLILASLLAFGSVVKCRPGEKAAERLFELGYGELWVGGDTWYKEDYDHFILTPEE